MTQKMYRKYGVFVPSSFHFMGQKMLILA